MHIKSEFEKIGIITSRGGHLYQVYQLHSWWSKKNRFWVTLPGEDVSSMLQGERVYFGFGPESRNIFNAIRNTLLAFRILFHERPNMLISCGAGIAAPFFYIGKLFGCKLVYIEPYDFISYPTLTGRLVSPVVDALFVQHKRQKRFFRNAEYKGSLL